MKSSAGIRNTRGVSVDSNIGWNDEIIKCGTLSNAIVLTLPPISALAGRFDFSPFVVIDDSNNASVNNITIQCSDADRDKINGQHTVVINTDGGSGSFKPTPNGYIFTSSASSQSISGDDTLALIIALG